MERKTWVRWRGTAMSVGALLVFCGIFYSFEQPFTRATKWALYAAFFTGFTGGILGIRDALTAWRRK